jgi:hypothetical protein
MALDEATRAFFAGLQAGGLRPLHELTVAQARRASASSTGTVPTWHGPPR